MTNFIDIAKLVAGGQSKHYPDWLISLYEVKEYVGREGKLKSKQVRIGQVTLKPNANYPVHMHPADEIYVQLNGKIQWLVGEKTKVVVSKTVISIPANTPHAMKNLQNSEADLIYLWYAEDGDITKLDEDAQLLS